MTEQGVASAIARSDGVASVASLTRDLRALGVVEGATVIVHSSLSSLGYVAGGAQAVVEALRACVGDDGTLVMPTHSANLSEPSLWKAPPVPEAWWPAIRSEMTAFDARLTPTRQMGAIVECFRHVDGVVRSPHPRLSFAACGPHAASIVAEHDLADGFGERSPLARCYDLDALVLLLGVGHGNNTSLHLAESRASFRKTRVQNGSPIIVDGVRQWVTYEHDEIDDDDFDALGVAFATTGAERRGRVGAGNARLMAQRAVVDFGVEWMNANRA